MGFSAGQVDWRSDGRIIAAGGPSDQEGKTVRYMALFTRAVLAALVALLYVDRVSGTRDTPRAEIVPLPGSVTAASASSADGVIPGRYIVVLKEDASPNIVAARVLESLSNSCLPISLRILTWPMS